MMRAFFLLLATTAILSAAPTKEFSRTVPLERGGRLTIDTYKGSIHVSAWDRREVEIHARIEEDPGWMSMTVDDVDIRVDAASANVRVKTDYRRNRGWFSIEGPLPSVYYTIHVPRDAALTVKDYKSDSEIAGVEGDVEFETYKGTARLSGLRAGLQINTYRGEIQATFAAFSKRTHVETYRGRIDLVLPRGSAFDLDGDVERHATLDCDFPRTLRTSTRERIWHSTVNGGGPPLKVKSYRGMIHVRAL
jgi:hypothetical protein